MARPEALLGVEGGCGLDKTLLSQMQRQHLSPPLLLTAPRATSGSDTRKERSQPRGEETLSLSNLPISFCSSERESAALLSFISARPCHSTDSICSCRIRACACASSWKHSLRCEFQVCCCHSGKSDR